MFDNINIYKIGYILTRFWSATNLYQILPTLTLLFRLSIEHLIWMMILVSLVSFGVRWHHLATDGITWRQWRQVCASDTKCAPLMPNWRHRRQISVSDGKLSVSDVKFGVTDVKWRHLTPNDAKWCQLTLKLGKWRRSSSPSASLSISSPVDLLTGTHWEGLALQEHLEECKHCSWSGWSQGPDPTWGEVNYSVIEFIMVMRNIRAFLLISKSQKVGNKNPGKSGLSSFNNINRVGPTYYVIVRGSIIPCNHLFSLHMGTFIKRW